MVRVLLALAFGGSAHAGAICDQQALFVTSLICDQQALFGVRVSRSNARRDYVGLHVMRGVQMEGGRIGRESDLQGQDRWYSMVC